jgi:thiosulfate/3-mercaptopyruvate sulfurtransferase
MADEPTPPLISTAELAARLGSPGLVVLDASWHLPTSGRDAGAEYLAGHVPGARFLDIDRVSDPAISLPHMLPPAELFEREVRALGVNRDSLIVVYDTTGANMSAARAWWMFRAFGHARVTVLDGGLGKWKAEGRPLEQGEVQVAPGDFTAGPPLEAVRRREEVAQALAGGTAQVVDVRSARRYAGLDPEPREGIPSGHMPGALNLPYGELVDENGLALPEPALRDRLARAGIALDRPVIASCGSGVSACTLLHALERLGVRARALYDGAWTEWASQGMPIVPGEAPR